MVTNIRSCHPEVEHWQRSKTAATKVNEVAYVATIFGGLLLLLYFSFWKNKAFILLKSSRTKEAQVDKATSSIFF